MTTAVSGLAYNANSTQANFQGWGSAVSSAIQTAGLTKTADTGQINWATVTAPAGGASAGYEIYAFNDTLQASTPIFIKIEYGGSQANANAPALFVTVGKGSDGAGNITGVLVTRTQLPSSTFQTTQQYTAAYACYSAALGVFHLSMFPINNSSGVGQVPSFMVERSRDATNVPTNKGIGVLLGNAFSPGVTISQWWTVNYSNAMWTNSAAPFFFPGTVGSATAVGTTLSSDGGTTVPVIPIPFVCPGVPSWLSAGIVAVAPADGGTFSATVNGQSHTYRTIAPANLGGVGGGSVIAIQIAQNASTGATATMPAAFLWE